MCDNWLLSSFRSHTSCSAHSSLLAFCSFLWSFAFSWVPGFWLALWVNPSLILTFAIWALSNFSPELIFTQPVLPSFSTPGGRCPQPPPQIPGQRIRAYLFFDTLELWFLLFTFPIFNLGEWFLIVATHYSHLGLWFSMIPQTDSISITWKLRWSVVLITGCTKEFPGIL